MRATMHPIKRTDYIKPLFSHGETLEITGLTADTLLTWHKRGLVPRIGRRKHQGRGFRRRYSTVDVAYLVILKHLAGRVPLISAGLAAAHATSAILAVYEMARFTERAEELHTLPGVTLVAYTDADGKTRFEVYSDREDAGVPLWPGGGIQTWMRTAVIEAALVLDLSTIALALFARIGDVMERQQARRAATTA